MLGLVSSPESKDSEASKESKEPDSSSEWTLEARDAQETAAAGVPYDCGYDLIVLDEIMPGSIAGTAAMAVLRRAGSNAVLVGFSGDNMDEKHFAAGADLSWRKPLPSTAELGAGLLKGVDGGLLAMNRVVNYCDKHTTGTGQGQ